MTGSKMKNIKGVLLGFFLAISTSWVTLELDSLRPFPILEPRGSSIKLCSRYHHLFMNLLHDSLDCADKFGEEPEEEKLNPTCKRIRALLQRYSILRSKYCYDE